MNLSLQQELQCKSDPPSISPLNVAASLRLLQKERQAGLFIFILKH